MSEKGWICPKCQRVYAPYVPNCFKCNEKPSFDGAADERAKIVAWLQKDNILDWLADEIEAGEHLK
jgi:uncharacterized OB-fold protein